MALTSAEWDDAEQASTPALDEAFEKEEDGAFAGEDKNAADDYDTVDTALKSAMDSAGEQGGGKETKPDEGKEFATEDGSYDTGAKEEGSPIDMGWC